VFRTYYAPLASFAFRYLRDASAAEDVVQDVFGALWNGRAKFTVTTSLKAYLFAAVRNRALNLRKHDAVVEEWEREESAEDVRELHPAPAPPDLVLDRKILEERLADAFESLPERQGQVMRLRWKDELSYAEIAEALGISVKGVEKHLSRGLAALKERLRYGCRFFSASIVTSGMDQNDKEISDWLRSQRTPGEPQFDADAAWKRFAAGHDVDVVPLRRRRIAVYFPAAIAAALLLAFGLRRVTTREPSFIETVTPNGRTAVVTLADGSEIRVDGGSRLRVPRDQRGNIDIQLEGAASFTIKHDPARTLRVTSGDAIITDIGTQFNVYAYPADTLISVTVSEGRISFASIAHTANPIELGAMQGVDLGRGGVVRSFTLAGAPADVGALVFDNLPLRDVAIRLERRYGVHVAISDASLGSKPVVARFHGETIDQVLDALSLALGAHYDRSDSTYTLRQGAK
jgi:RNA polymerase sigma-70 factor (ECF subfamily)